MLITEVDTFRIYMTIKDFANVLLDTQFVQIATGIWRNDNVIMTSKRRRFDVIMPLILCHMPIGNAWGDLMKFQGMG